MSGDFVHLYSCGLHTWITVLHWRGLVKRTYCYARLKSPLCNRADQVGSCCFQGMRWEALLALHGRLYPQLAWHKLIQISSWRDEIAASLLSYFSQLSYIYHNNQSRRVRDPAKVHEGTHSSEIQSDWRNGISDLNTVGHARVNGRAGDICMHKKLRGRAN